MNKKIFAVIASIIFLFLSLYFKLFLISQLISLVLIYLFISFIVSKSNIEKGFLTFFKFLFILIGIIVILFNIKLETYGAIGATVLGLVLGLAAQHTLGNIFAGIIISSLRIFKIGDKVGIISPSVPYFPLLLPPFKFFSFDYLIPYKGKIENIGVFFSKIITEDGMIMYIPNLAFLTGGVINISESKNEIGKLKVRLEVPLKKDVDKIIEKIKKSLSKYTSERFFIKEINVSEIDWTNPKNPMYILEIICYVRGFDIDDTKSLILKKVGKILKR
jgi:small-conductance mechanosensitive channel